MTTTTGASTSVTADHAGPAGRPNRHVAPRIYAGIFLLMAYAQSIDVPGFVDALRGYDLGAEPQLAAALIVLEWTVGLWLLFVPDLGARIWSVLFAILNTIWAGLAVQAYARGLVLDNCACFGSMPPRQPLSWFTLLQDAILLAASVYFLWLAWRRTSTAPA